MKRLRVVWMDNGGTRRRDDWLLALLGCRDLEVTVLDRVDQWSAGGTHALAVEGSTPLSIVSHRSPADLQVGFERAGMRLHRQVHQHDREVKPTPAAKGGASTIVAHVWWVEDFADASAMISALVTLRNQLSVRTVSIGGTVSASVPPRPRPESTAADGSSQVTPTDSEYRSSPSDASMDHWIEQLEGFDDLLRD